MASASLRIVPCPSWCLEEAIALVLCDVAPSHRRGIAGSLFDPGKGGEWSDPLSVALRDRTLRGAAWGQRQPGNTAMLWPPQLMPGEDERTAERLAKAVMAALDAAGVTMTQVLLRSADAPAVPLLSSVGFEHLADLFYLSCEAKRFPAEPPVCGELLLEAYHPAQRGRMMRLIERTYEGTLDCPALNGVRRMEDVLDGYQSTGVFRPENWQFVRAGGQDVGVLLMAAHPPAEHWELMYMGLVPEARGQGWGRAMAQHALWLARGAGVERVVLAVDAANVPALRMYGSAGFEIWDRRTVFAHFLARMSG